MSKKTKTLEQKSFDIALGAFLSEIPDEWDDLTESEQDSFIEQNKWEALEYYSTESVFSNIDSLQDDIVQLMKMILDLKTLDAPKIPSFLVNLRIVHGEYNEYLPCVIQASDPAHAGKRAILQHKRRELVWENTSAAYDCCGDIGLVIDTIKPIPAEHVGLLKHYIH